MDRKKAEFLVQAHLQALRIADIQQKGMNMKAKWDAFQKAETKKTKKAEREARKIADGNLTPADGLLTSKPKRGKLTPEEKAEARRRFGLTPEERKAEDDLKGSRGKGTTNATIKEDGMT